VPRDTYKAMLEEAARVSAVWVPDTDGDRIMAEIEGLRPRGTH